MRTINKYFYLLAAVALAGVVSCQRELEEYTPGEPDSETCEGVYFIKQDVIEETQIFDPTQLKRDTIIVRRSNSDGAITVKPTVTLSEMTKDGPVDSDASVFTVSDIAFKDGQEESFVALDFSNVKEGVQYILHLSIDGDEYSSKYSSSLKTCDYRVMCVKYEVFCLPGTGVEDEDGNYIEAVPSKVTFYQGFWGEAHTAYIKYYEVDGVRHCITFDEETDATEDEEPNWSYDGGFWGQDKDVHFEFDWYVAEEEACDCSEESHETTIPDGAVAGIPSGAQMIHILPKGVLNYGPYPLYAYDLYSYYTECKNPDYSRPFIHYIVMNDYLDSVSYYDGNGGFYFWLYGYTSPALGWIGVWTTGFDIVGIAEGFVRDDFTLELTAGMPEPDEDGNNAVPVDFEVGADVVEVGYTILKGKASSAVVTKEGQAIAKDTIDHKYATWVAAHGESFSDMIVPEDKETGIYTLVAVAIDTVEVRTNGKITRVDHKAKTTASVVFKYLKDGDASDVVLYVSAAGTQALASQGWDPQASFQYTITGSGITGAIPMVFTQAEVEAEGGIDVLVEKLKSGPNEFYSKLTDEEFTGKLSSGQLASANDKGFTDIFADGVTPGTLYYVIVWATNGYDVAVEYATVTTTGDPLPIYQKFTYKSRKEELIDGKSASDFFGTYNVYAIDMSGSSSLRSYMGKATLAAYDTEKYGAVEEHFNAEEGEALLGEAAQVSGLSFGAGGEGFDDTILLDFGENPFADDDVSDAKGFFVVGGTTADKKSAALYNYISIIQDFRQLGYSVVGYPVADGYLAFVAESYYGDNYGYYPNLNFYNEELELDVMYRDYLLVDPAKDDNGLAPQAVSAAVSAAKRVRNNKVEVVGNNLLKVPVGGKRFSADSHFITILGVKGLAPVETVERVAASHNLSISRRWSVKDREFTLVKSSY